MIKIGDDWAISIDETCVTILKRRVVQDKDSPNYGEESWENKWYYTDLEMALQSFVDRDLQSQITSRLPNLVDRIKELKKWIAVTIKETIAEHHEHPLTKGYGDQRREKKESKK